MKTREGTLAIVLPESRTGCTAAWHGTTRGGRILTCLKLVPRGVDSEGAFDVAGKLLVNTKDVEDAGAFVKYDAHRAIYQALEPNGVLSLAAGLPERRRQIMPLSASPLLAAFQTFLCPDGAAALQGEITSNTGDDVDVWPRLAMSRHARHRM